MSPMTPQTAAWPDPAGASPAVPATTTNHREWVLNRRTWLGVCGISILAGCMPELPTLEGVQEKSQPLSATSWDALRRIVEAMSVDARSKLPRWLPVCSFWQESRTLEIAQLAVEEQGKLVEFWQPKRYQNDLAWEKSLRTALLSEHVTLEQFIALTLCVGVACSSKLASKELADSLLQRRGDLAIERLSSDHRIYSKLAADERFAVIRDTEWLSRMELLSALRSVPAENVTLVTEQASWIEAHLPEHVRPDPKELLMDRRRQNGVPFEELPTSGSDSQLRSQFTPAPDQLRTSLNHSPGALKPKRTASDANLRSRQANGTLQNGAEKLGGKQAALPSGSVR